MSQSMEIVVSNMNEQILLGINIHQPPDFVKSVPNSLSVSRQQMWKFVFFNIKYYQTDCVDVVMV